MTRIDIDAIAAELPPEAQAVFRERRLSLLAERGWHEPSFTPHPGTPVIGLFNKANDHCVEWVVLTEEDGWYAANPDGNPVNRCPVPTLWCYAPALSLIDSLGSDA